MIATAVCAFGGGTEGTYTDINNPLLARQSPLEYLRSLEVAVKGAIKGFKEKGGAVNNIIGIGVDSTGSTPIPVKRNMRPLAELPAFKNNPNAYAWLWKDHTAVKEAIQITEKAKETRPEYLEKCGGTYSSEWFWSKVWHCLNCDPEVFHAADSWVAPDSATLQYRGVIPASRQGTWHLPPAGPPEAPASRATSATPRH